MSNILKTILVGTALVLLAAVIFWQMGDSEDRGSSSRSDLEESGMDPAGVGRATSSMDPSGSSDNDPSSSEPHSQPDRSRPSLSQNNEEAGEEGSTDANFELRLQSLVELKKHFPPPDPETVALLDQMLYSDDAAEKAALLGELRKSAADPAAAAIAVLEALENGDEDVRMEVLDVLPVLDKPGALATLRELAVSDPSPRIRERAGQMANYLTMAEESAPPVPDGATP